MKRTLSFMVMALALLLTQCRKSEVKFPTPSSAEGVTVSMTVTAGPGSKTDITDEGTITWSKGDKLYVGDGSKCIGCLTLTSGADNPTGTFSGEVTLPTGTENGEKTFHFFYLGSGNGVTPTYGAESVDVSFATQEIYANGTNLSDDAKKFHVGYGSANGTVTDGVVTGINVTLVSKVALAYFSFTKNDAPYTYELTLSGDNIYNDMTVNFGGTFTGKTKGNINLTGGHSERYVMLVPAGTSAATLNFGGGDVTGSTTLANGIEANKFYRVDGSMPIEVEMKPVEFSVAAGTKVKFAPGNLYYDADDNECHWKFEANQWDFRTYGGLGSCIGGVYDEDSGTPSGDWGLFGWSTDAANNNWGMHTKQLVVEYYGGNFKDWGENVIGSDPSGTWHTLSRDEWDYLLNTGNAESGARTDANRFAKANVNGVNGLLIFPDGYNNNVRIPDGSITGVANVNEVKTTNYPPESIPADTWAAMESSGVVFLPAAGYRTGTSNSGVGTTGFYWSKIFEGKQTAFYMGFEPASVATDSYYRYVGGSVRLVRSAS